VLVVDTRDVRWAQARREFGGTGSHLTADEVQALADVPSSAAVVTHFLPDAAPVLIAHAGLAPDVDESRALASELAGPTEGRFARS
jgi:hypothetical protein